MLVQQGDAVRGTQLLRMATTLAPGDPGIRLHYAKALAKIGDKAGARRELEAVAAADRAGTLRAETNKLKSEL